MLESVGGEEDFKTKAVYYFIMRYLLKLCMHPTATHKACHSICVCTICILNSLNVNRDKTEKLMETKAHFGGWDR